MRQVRSRDGAYDRRGRGDRGDTAPYALDALIRQAGGSAFVYAQLRTLARQTHNVAAEALAPVLKEFFAS